MKKRKVSLKGVSYNNTDIVFNRFKMFNPLMHKIVFCNQLKFSIYETLNERFYMCEFKR